MEGLRYLENIKPTEADDFLKIIRFSYICPFGNKIRVLIDAQIYKHNICVLSFFHKKDIDSSNRYKTRVKMGTGQTRALLKACVYVYLHSIEEDHALVFSAANDIDDFKEYNDRYSCYIKILSRELSDTEYDITGSMGLNLKMYYHRSFQYKEEANSFYDEFEEKCRVELEQQKEEYRNRILEEAKSGIKSIKQRRNKKDK